MEKLIVVKGQLGIDEGQRILGLSRGVQDQQARLDPHLRRGEADSLLRGHRLVHVVGDTPQPLVYSSRCGPS